MNGLKRTAVLTGWALIAVPAVVAAGYGAAHRLADLEAFMVATLDSPSGSLTTRFRVTGEEDPARAVFENVKVGIGVAQPAEDLEVAGAVKIGAAAGAADGTLRWTGSDFEGRKGGQWVSLTAGSGSGGTGTGTAILQFGAGSDNVGGPRFLWPSSSDWVTDTAEIKMRVPREGTIKNMYLVMRANSIFPATGTFTYTLRKNGVDTALAVTVGDGQLEASNTTQTVTVAAGDKISVKSAAGGVTGELLLDLFVQFEFTD